MRGPFNKLAVSALRGSACSMLVALSALEVLVMPVSGATVAVVPSPYAPPVPASVSVGNINLGVDCASLSALVVARVTARVTVPTYSSC